MHFYKATTWSLLCVVLLLIRCQGGGREQGQSPPDGKEIFKRYCTTCHGAKGNLQTSSAADLTQTKLTLEERIETIKHGKGIMTSFQGVLTEEEIAAVARYTQNLNEQ